MYRALLAIPICAGLWAAAGCADDSGDDELVFLATDEPELGKSDRAAEPQVEIKVTLPEAQAARALSIFKLTKKAATARAVTFYDLPDLSLFEAGLVLRSRKVENGADDSTAKVRPLAADEVDASWFGVSGFKCEEDRVGARRISSCSLTVRQDGGEIDAVEDGERAIDKLFSDDQETFADGYGAAVDWEALAVLGPTETLVWKLRAKGFAHELTFERWFLPDGELLEVSCKVGLDQAAKAQKDLADFLAKKGFDGSDTQETKTRRALEAYASEL